MNNINNNLIKNNNIFRIKYSNDINEIKFDNKDKVIICIYFIFDNNYFNEQFINLCNNNNNIIILLINICEYEPNIDNEEIFSNNDNIKFPYVKIFNDLNNKFYNIIYDILNK